MKVVDNIFGHIDAGSVIALVSMDIAAAFDIVNYAILLNEALRGLWHHTSQVLQWIC